MVRYAKRTDRNHAEIRDALRARGFLVADLSGVGHGVPDLRVLIDVERKLSLYLEIKEGKAPLTVAEQDWFAHNWNSRVVNSVASALAAIDDFRRLG